MLVRCEHHLKMLVWFYLLLLPLVTKGCMLAGKKETITVTGMAGDSVLLPCTCTDLQSKPAPVKWKIYSHTWVEIEPESKEYKDRVQLVTDAPPGNVSLLISHLTEKDAGDYMCSITNGGLKYLRLKVEGCKLNQHPEKVTGIVGQSVLLPCSCSELQAKSQTFTWSFSTETNHIQIFPKDERNLYTDRVQFFNDRSPGNLSLLISHLSLQDEGWYRCEIRKYHVKDIRLTVIANTTFDAPSTPSPDFITDSLPYVPIALVTVIFLHIIVAVVYCTTRKKGPGRDHYRGDDGDGAVSLH